MEKLSDNYNEFAIFPIQMSTRSTFFSLVVGPSGLSVVIYDLQTIKLSGERNFYPLIMGPPHRTNVEETFSSYSFFIRAIRCPGSCFKDPAKSYLILGAAAAHKKKKPKRADKNIIFHTFNFYCTFDSRVF